MVIGLTCLTPTQLIDKHKAHYQKCTSHLGDFMRKNNPKTKRAQGTTPAQTQNNGKISVSQSFKSNQHEKSRLWYKIKVSSWKED